jgi:hypothetical protein
MQDKIQLLRNYKAQNPRKYFQKYGDLLPEEAVQKLKVAPVYPSGPVKVEIGVKKEVEMEFKPEPDVLPPVESQRVIVPPSEEKEQIKDGVPTEVEKPKRGRKPKDA